MAVIPAFAIQLFPSVEEQIVRFLHSLTEKEWTNPTSARGQTVKGVAAHLPLYKYTDCFFPGGLLSNATSCSGEFLLSANRLYKLVKWRMGNCGDNGLSKKFSI
jgi:hypothetical protein